MESVSVPEEVRDSIDPQLAHRIISESKLHKLRERRRGSRSPTAFSNISMTNRCLADLTRLDQQVAVPFVAIDHRYPPCSVEPEALISQIAISDLKMETHHRGRILIVRTIPRATQSWARLLVAVKDEFGSSCVVTVSHHMLDVSADEKIPTNSVLAIKEPYLHMDGAHPPQQATISLKDLEQSSPVVICIDHPLDLLLLPGSSVLIPASFSSTVCSNATVWKERGNTAIDNKRFLEAQTCYTEGILATSGDDGDLALTADLFRNRSQAFLSLAFYGYAKKDALRSILILPSVDVRTKTLNAEAYFRAALSSYNLGQYDEADSFLVKHERLLSNDEAASVLYEKNALRLHERETGHYNFKKIRERLLSTQKVDVADFLCRTEIRNVAYNGRNTGLFVTKAGEILFCERSFVVMLDQAKEADYVVWADVNGQEQMTLRAKHDVSLWKDLVTKVARNVATMPLDSGLDLSGFIEPDGVIPGSLNNAFLYDNSGQTARSLDMPCNGSNPLRLEKKTGLWLQASNMKHSCIPNTATALIGDLIIIRASRDVRAGDELFTSYIPFHDDFEKFQQDLMEKDGVVCDCALCDAETRTPPVQRAARQEIRKAIRDFCGDPMTVNGNTSKAMFNRTLKQGEELAKKLSATYDDNTFTGTMPRRGLAAIYLKLENIREHSVPTLPKLSNVSGYQEFEGSIQYVLKAARALGCDIKVNPAGDVSFADPYGVQIRGKQALLHMCAMLALIQGRLKLGKQFGALSKKMHLLANGDTTELEEVPA